MTMISDWITVGTLDDFHAQSARRIQTPAGEVAIFKTTSGDIFAIRNACPHLQGPLSEGIVHGKSVTCPLHNWVIDLESGEVQGPDTGCTRTFPIKIDGDQVLLGNTSVPALEAAE